jgi:hypothetical protein
MVFAVPAGEEVRHRFVRLENPLFPPLRVVAGRTEDRRGKRIARDRRELLKALEEVEDAGANLVDQPIVDHPCLADQAVLVVRVVVVAGIRRITAADALGNAIFLERIRAKEQSMTVVQLVVDPRVPQVPGLWRTHVDVELCRAGRRTVRDVGLLVLVAGEEERLVAHDWAAERQTLLRLMQWGHRAGQPVGRVHRGVTQVVIVGPTKLVRP